jgi:hypothetical protein
MTAPNLEMARKSIKRARELSFVFGLICLVGAFGASFLLLTLRDKRFSPIYNQSWLRDRFSEAASPAEKDRIVYSLLDVIATMDHYYFVGGIMLLALAMLMSLFAFIFYRYASTAASHLNERAPRE